MLFRSGAPANLFFSADEEWMDYLDQRGLMEPGTRVARLGNRLVLVAPTGAGRKVELEKVWRKSRDGHTGARPTGEIGFATLRGGEEVGVHTVFFAAAGERLELTHRSFSREGYAAGAVRGALWLKGKKPGLYGMKDVLGL